MGLTYEERIFWKQIPDPKSFDSFQDPKFNFHSDLDSGTRFGSGAESKEKSWIQNRKILRILQIQICRSDATFIVFRRNPCTAFEPH